MFQSTSAAQPTPAESASATPISHESVRHLLVGSPRVVKYTQGQLSQAGYAEMLRWTDLFSLTNGQLIITPGPSDVMSMLVKLVHLV